VAATSLTYLRAVTFNTTSFPELADFIQIYDECRMIGVKLHYTFHLSTAATAAPTSSIAGAAIGFDPSANAPSSITSILQESFCHGPLWITVNGVADYPTQRPFSIIHGKVPSLAPITASDCPGSAWFTVDGATPPVLCTLMAYGTALGTLGVIQVVTLCELDLEFRLRT